MERNLKLLLGFIGGWSLLLVNRLFSGHSFLGSVVGFILNDVIMRILSFAGFIVVEVISIILIIDAIKYTFKKYRS